MNNFYKFLFTFAFSILLTNSLTSSLTNSRPAPVLMPKCCVEFVKSLLYKAAYGLPSYKGQLKSWLRYANAQGINVVELRNNDTEESLFHAAVGRVISNNIEADLRELLKYPFDVNDTWYSETPLYRICESTVISLKDKCARVNFLIGIGANVTKLSKWNRTVFHALAQGCFFNVFLGTRQEIRKAIEEIVALILAKAPEKDHSSFINRCDEFGNTALHLAADSCGLYHQLYQAELFNVLVEKGADTTIKNEEDKDPKDILKRKGKLNLGISSSSSSSSSSSNYGLASNASPSLSSSPPSSAQEKETDPLLSIPQPKKRSKCA